MQRKLVMYVGSVALTIMHATSAYAQASRHILTGRVVAGVEARPIGGADVELNGRLRVITSSDGSFRFADVVPGPAVLQVRALGYEDLDFTLQLRGDTAVELRLTALPIRLDAIDVVSRTITVTGRVTDAVKKMALDGMVYARPGSRKDDTSGSGRYRITAVPATDSTMIMAEAFGHLPQRKFISALRDTTVNFELEVDPVVAIMVAQHITKIEARSDSFPYVIERIHIDQINQAGSLLDVLKYQFDMDGAKCIYVDEQRNSREFRMLMPDQIHYIEIIDRGKGSERRSAEMIRVYTKAYFQNNIAHQGPLKPMFVQRRGPAIMCK